MSRILDILDGRFCWARVRIDSHFLWSCCMRIVSNIFLWWRIRRGSPRKSCRVISILRRKKIHYFFMFLIDMITILLALMAHRSLHIRCNVILHARYNINDVLLDALHHGLHLCCKLSIGIVGVVYESLVDASEILLWWYWHLFPKIWSVDAARNEARIDLSSRSKRVLRSLTQLLLYQ